MNEARPYASLSSGLLARKGTAKPAMRPQGYSGGFEDLGWNDMGHGPGEEGRPPPAPEHVPSSIAALTPAPKHGRPAPSDAHDTDETEELEGVEEAGEAGEAEEIEAVQEYHDFQQADEADEAEVAEEAGEEPAPTFEDPAPVDAHEAADDYEAAEEAGQEFAPTFEDPAPVEAPEAADEAGMAEDAAQEFGPTFEDPTPLEAHEPAEAAHRRERYDAPSVVAQQRAILERFDGEEEAAPPIQANPAPVVSLPQRHIDAVGRKAAFTLRLDSDRHLRLRLACAVSGRSAQQIVARALDQALANLPEIEALASQVPAKPGRARAKRN